MNATEITIEPQKSVPGDLSGARVNENPAISHIISSDTYYPCLQGRFGKANQRIRWLSTVSYKLGTQNQ